MYEAQSFADERENLERGHEFRSGRNGLASLVGHHACVGVRGGEGPGTESGSAGEVEIPACGVSGGDRSAAVESGKRRGDEVLDFEGRAAVGRAAWREAHGPMGRSEKI